MNFQWTLHCYKWSMYYSVFYHKIVIITTFKMSIVEFFLQFHIHVMFLPRVNFFCNQLVHKKDVSIYPQIFLKKRVLYDAHCVGRQVTYKHVEELKNEKKIVAHKDLPSSRNKKMVFFYFMTLGCFSNLQCSLFSHLSHCLVLSLDEILACVACVQDYDFKNKRFSNVYVSMRSCMPKFS